MTLHRMDAHADVRKRRYRANQKRRGLCILCSEPRAQGTVRCIKHLRHQREMRRICRGSTKRVRGPAQIHLHVLCYVAAHLGATGEGPAINEIAEYFYSSVKTVWGQLAVLQCLGLLARTRAHRSARLTPAGWRALGMEA